MSVLLIAGSPSDRSRTAAVLEAVGQRLELRGVQVDRLRVRDLSPQALLLAFLLLVPLGLRRLVLLLQLLARFLAFRPFLVVLLEPTLELA